MSKTSSKNESLPRVRGLVIVGAAALIIATGWWWVSDESGQDILNRARVAHDRGDFEESERLAMLAAETPALRLEALTIAAVSAEKLEKPQVAIEHYDRILAEEQSSIHALIRSGELTAYDLGRLSDAEQRLTRALDLESQSDVARTALLNLLLIQGRRLTITPLLISAVQAKVDPQYLFLLGTPDQVVETATVPLSDGRFISIDVRSFLTNCLRRNPDDVLPKLGLARLAQSRNELDEALELCRDVATNYPKLAEAHACVGLLSAESSQLFQEWQQQVPPTADNHADVWYARGIAATKFSDLHSATRCFWECVVRAPNHLAACLKLSQLLNSLDRKEAAADIGHHAEQLSELTTLLRVVSGDGEPTAPRHLARIKRIVVLAENLGRVIEARAWCRVAMTADDSQWFSVRLQALENLEIPQNKQTADFANPALRHDLSSFPLPDWNSLPSREISDHSAESRITFRDDARAAGIDFQYFNGANPNQPGRRIQETNGGGVAVLDFDADGLPDILATQGCRWPPSADQTEHLDQLFRNTGMNTFDCITEFCGIHEPHYSQGTAVGDLNSDGFPDLVIAAMGENSCFLNNGDGTFERLPDSAGFAGDSWSTSCAIADLNGDRLPDIYVVNYLRGDRLFDLFCQGQRPCAPADFESTQDQIFLNVGDGSFRDVAKTAGIIQPNGKGMGISVADYFGTGKLNVFIANDETPNFFFRNTSDRGSRTLSFVESAFVTGLALDGNGGTQACMGIAVDDTDGDGLLDVFVTNFAGQPNTLYRRRSTEFFTDDARTSRLRDSGFHQLGFGTQFFDADLDGHPDLVIANGHVDDHSSEGTPYRMRPQFHRNIGDGRFEEHSPQTLGPWFEDEALGRALATLDWNRDGLTDFSVTHLDTPLALVTNTTSRPGRFLQIRVIGVQSSRDAIGTTLRLSLDDRIIVKQLTAGDGFQASNERIVTFGLGDQTEIERLDVRWPSGKQQTYSSINADTRIVLVEGHELPYAIH